MWTFDIDTVTVFKIRLDLLVSTFEDLLVSSQLQKAEEKIDTHLRNTDLA